MEKSTITVQLKEDVWAPFDALMKEAGFRRDEYLNRVLPAELKVLAEQRPCDDVGAEYLRDEFRGTRSKRVKLSVRLDRKVIGATNRLCKQKRVVRDLFLDLAIQSLTARIKPALEIVRKPRLSDSKTFEEYVRASKDLAAALEYSEMLIWDKPKVENHRRLFREVDELLKSRASQSTFPKDDAASQAKRQ